MSELVLNGRITEISDTVTVKEFSKRNFVIDTGGDYPNQFQLEFIKDKCNLLDKFNVGDQVEVSYSLKGRAWTNKEGKVSYFTTLAAWRIGKGEADNYAPALETSGVEDDSLPF